MPRADGVGHHQRLEGAVAARGVVTGFTWLPWLPLVLSLTSDISNNWILVIADLSIDRLLSLNHWQVDLGRPSQLVARLCFQVLAMVVSQVMRDPKTDG